MIHPVSFATDSLQQNLQPDLFSFNLEKTTDTYLNYTTHFHSGLTLVIGHPFNDEEFRNKILDEQRAIQDVFIRHQMENLLVLYDTESQVHATVIELASQHDKTKTDQRILEDLELTQSCKTMRPMSINYAIEWIKKTKPFDIELGPNVLSKEHSDQTILIAQTGQILMKGRAKNRKKMAKIRSEFEDAANIIHKFGRTDDEVYFIIGYLKPDLRLHDRSFRMDLERCIQMRRPHIQLTLKVDAVKLIVYDRYSLDPASCLWESKELKLLKEPDLPQKTLLETIRDVNHRLHREFDKKTG